MSGPSSATGDLRRNKAPADCRVLQGNFQDQGVFREQGTEMLLSVGRGAMFALNGSLLIQTQPSR